MAEGRSIGTVFVELDLDPSRYTRGQQQLYKEATTTSLSIEENFKKLGIKTSAEFELMRQKIANAYASITHSSQATANDIVRAERAKNAQLTALNEQQFGKQTSLLDGLKANWIAVSAAVVGAWVAIGKGIAFAELGAKAQQAEESFRLIAQSSGIAADALLANLDRAAAGTVDDSDIMQAAVKGMILGLNDKQLVTIMENARLAARYAGTDVKTAFEDITNAIGTDMPRALRQYGLITREESRLVQEALAAGAKDISLYNIAMAHAAVNAARFGEAQTNAAEALQTFHAVINQTREAVGKAEISLAKYLLAGALGLDAFATRGVAALLKLMGQEDAYTQLLDAANEMMKKRNAILGIQTEEEKKAAEAKALGAKTTLQDAETALKAEQEKLRLAAGRKAAQAEALKDLDLQMATLKQGESIRAALAGQNQTRQVAEAERLHVRLLALLEGHFAQGLISEKDYLAKRSQLQGEWVQSNVTALAKAAADYKQYTEKIKDLDRQMAEAKTATADLLAGIKQSGMTPGEVFADRERRAQDKLADAMQLAGQDQIDALKKVQAEYGALALEAARSAQVQKQAAQQAKEAWLSDLPGSAFLSRPGQLSEAWKQFFGAPKPGEPGSPEWWKESDPSKRLQPALGDANTLAAKVLEIGKNIEQAFQKAKDGAQASANAAKHVVDETERNLRAVQESISAVNALADAYLAAAAAARSIPPPPTPGPPTPTPPSGGPWVLPPQVGPEGTWSGGPLPPWTGEFVPELGPGEGGPGGGTFQHGGFVPGPVGAPRRVIAHGGEAILNQQEQTVLRSLTGGGGRGNITIEIHLSGRSIAEAVRIPLEDAIAAGKIIIRGRAV